jgi:hypothetical protein
VRGGGGRAEADRLTRQCLSEGGKRGFGPTGALADLRAQRAAHNLAMSQMKESATWRRNWAPQMGKVEKERSRVTLKCNEIRRVRDIVSFIMHHRYTPSPLYVYGYAVYFMIYQPPRAAWKHHIRTCSLSSQPARRTSPPPP